MVRVRIAPSPTGSLHVGNARTALFNYLFARQNQGTFIIRMEDTDAARSSRESETSMLEDFQWMKMDSDEGPLQGGNFGPYRQTERLGLYSKYTQMLLNNNKAYPCFCSAEHLQEQREQKRSNNQPYRYDRACANLDADTVAKRIKQGEPYAVRLRTPQEHVVVHDIIRGDIQFETDSFRDFIIVRPDGMPVYNYVVAMDDHLMEITHVIRGDDHISNTPKQVLVYDALGFTVPKFAHIPMILGKDHAKLSKRHGDTTVANFKEKGFLQEALINYLALLSWSPKTEREFFTMDELIQEFQLESVSKSAAVFDVDKLKWMNGNYIRQMEPNEYYKRILDFVRASELFTNGHITESDIANEERFTKILLTVRDNLETLMDVGQYLQPFFTMPGLTKGINAELSPEAKEILELPTSKDVLEGFLSELKKVENEGNSDGNHDTDTYTDTYIDAQTYKGLTKIVQKNSGAKGKALFMTIRVGISGEHKGPDMAELVSLLSVAEMISRLDYTIANRL